MTRRMSRFWTGLLSTWLLLGIAPAEASHIFSTCDIVCEIDCDDPGSGPNCVEAEGGKCILGTNLTCSSTTVPAVRLRDGMDLEMDGHTLACQSGVNCHNAVQMESGSGSKVVNNSTTEAVITGGFFSGVDCGLTGASEVTGIRIESTLIGVRDCKTIKNNVLTGLGRTYLTANWGIQTQGVTASGDLVSGNYIADKSRGILVNTTDKVDLVGNIFHTTGWTACGVELTAGSQASLDTNTFLGVGNAGFGTTRKIVCLPSPEPTGVTYDKNICDRDHPDCASCISGGRCMPFAAPFVP